MKEILHLSLSRSDIIVTIDPKESRFFTLGVSGHKGRIPSKIEGPFRN